MLLNTQHYKVQIKGKELHPSLHLGVVAYEKVGMVGQFNISYLKPHDCVQTNDIK